MKLRINLVADSAIAYTLKACSNWVLGQMTILLLDWVIFVVHVTLRRQMMIEPIFSGVDLIVWNVQQVRMPEVWVGNLQGEKGKQITGEV